MTKATKRKQTPPLSQKPVNPPKKVSENFSHFFATSLYGAVFAIFAMLDYTRTHSPDAHTYFHVYVYGWIAALGAAIALFFPLKFIRENWYGKESCLYSAAALVNLAFTLYVYDPVQWSNTNLLKYFLCIQPAGFILAWILDRRGAYSAKVNLLYGFMILMGLGWVNLISPGWYKVGDWKAYNYILFTLATAVIMIGTRSLSRPEGIKRLDWTLGNVKIKKSIVLYFLAFLTIGFCINTLFNYDPHHYSFYLGPVADLAAGKALLVNINCQYGVLVIYFLRFFFLFLPMSLVSFSFLLVILTGIQYLLFYFVVRHLLRSELLAFAALVFLLIIQHLAQINTGILFPSVGPLRFGFVYLLMALIVLRNEHPTRRRLFFWLESLLVGTAFFWSLEVCVYVVLPYLGLLLFETLDLKEKFRLKGHELFRRTGILSLCILAIGALLYLDVFRRSHEWPQWASYFDYLNTYGNGYDMLPLPPIHAWWMAVFIFYFSLIALLGIFFSKAKTLPVNLNVVVIALFCGALEFTYYLRRAHINNLFHVSMPPILLFFFWIYYIRRYDPPSLPDVLKKAGYVLAVLLAAFFLQKPAALAVQEINIQPASPLVMVSRILDLFPQFHNADPTVVLIDQLMDKYSGKAKSLVYLLGDEGFYVSMYSGRTNVYPYNDAVQPTLSPLAMARINACDPHLKTGDYIYYGFVPKGDFEEKILEKLRSGYDLETVEQTGGVTVFKVVGAKAAS